MRNASLLGLSICMVAGGASCQKGQGEPGKAPKEGQELPGNFVGRYQEGLQNSTEHTLKAREWTQLDPGADTPVKLQVTQLQSLPGGTLAVVLDYVHPSSKESRRIRADLWRESERILWLCRHPEIRGQEPLQAVAGDPADLLGQGCFGAPWRKLERVANDATPAQ